MKVKLILIGVGIALLLLIARGAFASVITRNNEVCFCHNVNNNPHTICTSNQGQINGHNNHVNNGEDTAGACAEPTITPTVTPIVVFQPIETPTPTQTPEPTIDLCDTLCCDDECEPTPTQEATPTPTVQETQKSVSSSSQTQSPAGCDALVPERVTDIWVERGEPNDGKLTVRWGANPQWSHAHIRYSEDEGQWRYGLLNTPNDGSEEIGGLRNGQHYWFAVAFVNSCSVGAYSNSWDPIP